VGQMALRSMPTGVVAVGVIVLLGGVAAPAVHGQEIPTFEGEEVTVAGRRPQLAATTPAYVTVLTREDLQRLGFATLGEALAFLAEVAVRTAGPGPGGFQQLSIRGSTPQQVLILLDGVPLNGTAQFGINLSTIPLDEVERVEVLRGPYSAIYGNAMAGAVSIRLRAAPRSSLSFAGGSFGTAGGALRLGRAWSGGQLTFGGEYLRRGGERPNSDAARFGGSLRLVIRPDAARAFTLSLFHAGGESGLPGPTFFPTPDSRLTDARTVLGLAWEAAGGGSTTLVRLWGLADRLAESSPGFASDDRGLAYGGSWQQVIRLASGAVLTAGVDLERASFSSTSTFATFQNAATTGAAYVQYDALVRPRTLVGVGFRYDVHSVYGGEVNPRAGFVHFLSDRVRIRGGVGRAFRAPTFFELAYPGCSNPALRPEQAWSADLGIEAAPRPGVLLRLNGFLTDARDLIVGGCAPLNVGSAQVAGLSVEALGRLPGGWTVTGNLTWTQATDRGAGLPLLRVAPWQASLVLRRYWSERDGLAILVNYVSARDDLDTSVFPSPRVTLPGYVTVGLRYERRVGDRVITAGVDNLLDARYETVFGFPAARRTVFVRFGSAF